LRETGLDVSSSGHLREDSQFDEFHKISPKKLLNNFDAFGHLFSLTDLRKFCNFGKITKSINIGTFYSYNKYSKITSNLPKS